MYLGSTLVRYRTSFFCTIIFKLCNAEETYVSFAQYAVDHGSASATSNLPTITVADYYSINHSTTSQTHALYDGQVVWVLDCELTALVLAETAHGYGIIRFEERGNHNVRAGFVPRSSILLSFLPFEDPKLKLRKKSGRGWQKKNYHFLFCWLFHFRFTQVNNKYLQKKQ